MGLGPPEAGKDFDGVVASASATNLGLAVELYLKALRMATGLAPKRTHALPAAFDPAVLPLLK